MSEKDLLGTLSPAYGMMTGHGLFGKEVGVLPAIAKDMRDDKKKEEDKAKGMKKGGLVSASKRADGCCIKGKTKGKMV
jgi:hypothetical protein